MNEKVVGCLTFCVLCFLLIGCISCFSKSTPSSSTSTAEVASDRVKIGEYGILKSNDSNLAIPLFMEKRYHGEYGDLCALNDTLGIEQMFRNGKIVAITQGTKVLHTGSDWFAVEVRIYDGPFTGILGWVSTEYLKPTPETK